MATHSSILAWEIPWTEESGGPQSMGCKELDTTEHAHTQYFQSGKDFPLSLERLKATYVAFKNKGGTTIYTWSQKIGGWGPEFAFLTIIF